MTNTIHILNGDAILPIFKQSGIAGEVVIWREMLCEGPIDRVVGSDDFWKKRYGFFEQEFGLGKLEYFDKTIKEIQRLDELAIVDEVVLWFEYDLFCQVNLMAACSYLLQDYRKDVTYHLVCTGWSKARQKWMTLSDFSAEQYVDLYENRLKITQNNLIFADESWKLYVENNAEDLKNFNFTKWSKFQYLQLAMDQHLKRFPSENGLNEIENKLLQLINEKEYTQKELVFHMLVWQNENSIYGFSDVLYEIYLKRLSRFYEIKTDVYQLNDLGKKRVIN